MEAGSAEAVRDAARLVAEARRLYDAAELVHGRTASASLDSVPLLVRALHLLGEATLALAGDSGATWERAVEQLSTANRREHYVERDLDADLDVLSRALSAWQEPAVPLDRALSRDYDRVFASSAKLLKAVALDVESRLPAVKRRSWKLVAFVAVAALVVGGLAGRFSAGSARPAAAPVSPRPATAARQHPGRTPRVSDMQATYYADETFGQALATVDCSRLDFDWHGGAPPAIGQNDHFSVRFTGTIEAQGDTSTRFYVSSDDGSRLYVDDQPVVDNWGVHTLATREGALVLTSGKHRLRVEYFDGTGDASVKVEWSAPGMARTVLDTGG